MKNKFIPDIFVYMIAPMIVSNLINVENFGYTTVALIFFIFIYSFITRKIQFRINISGLIFACIYIGISLLKQNAESDFVRYTYDIYFLMISLMILLSLKFINKNVIQQIYIDILRANGHKKNYIYNFFKKEDLRGKFEKTSSIVNVHLLSMIFIKVYSIITYGSQNYLITADLEILVCTIFVIVEIYMFYKIKQDYKPKKNEHLKINKNKSSLAVLKNIKNEDKEKVIYLNKYKKTNK